MKLNLSCPIQKMISRNSLFHHFHQFNPLDFINFDIISLELPILYFRIMMYFCHTDLCLSVQTV